MNSPLGPFATYVAAITALLLIGSYALGTLFGVPGATDLKEFAILAIGAVFGSAAGSYVTTNGLGKTVDALHKRQDKIDYINGIAVKKP